MSAFFCCFWQRLCIAMIFGLLPCFRLCPPPLSACCFFVQDQLYFISISSLAAGLERNETQRKGWSRACNRGCSGQEKLMADG